MFYLLVTTFHYLLISLQQARHAEQQQATLALEAREAELRALRAQVQPHFLFNSLNAISSLVARDPEQARQMCISLADFLRLTLGSSDQREIPLGDELALVRTYLAVERIRLGERLLVVEDVGDGAAVVSVPPCILQPLVENAVRHGIAMLEQGGTLRLSARIEGGYLLLTVTNPIDPTRLRYREGYGLANVRRRLAARYRKEGFFAARPIGGEFHAFMRLPLESSA